MAQRTSQKRLKHKSDAREFYGMECTFGMVADRLPVSINTIRSWHHEDAGTARDWDAYRKDCYSRSPLSRLQKLRNRFDLLVEKHGDDLENSALDDRLGKLYSMMKDMEERLATPDRIAAALGKFIGFARNRVTPEEAEMLDRLLGDFDQAMTTGEVSVEL